MMLLNSVGLDEFIDVFFYQITYKVYRSNLSAFYRKVPLPGRKAHVLQIT